MRYKLVNHRFGNVVACVVRASDGASIPLNMENRDCVTFYEDWKAGAEVLDANGSLVAYNPEAVVALGLEAPS